MVHTTGFEMKDARSLSSDVIAVSKVVVLGFGFLVVYFVFGLVVVLAAGFLAGMSILKQEK